MILDSIISQKTVRNADRLRPKKASRQLAVIKSISWRVIGTLDTLLISLILTGDFTMALSISGVELVTKMTLYYFHERFWDKISK